MNTKRPAIRRPLLLLPLAVSLTWLSACDNTPRADFAQQYEAAQSANADDPYMRLDEVPRVESYRWWSEKQRVSQAAIEAGKLHERYASMLALFDKEPMQPALGELASQCRKAFGQASDFAANLRDASQDPQAITETLRDCRSQAMALADKNDDKAVRAQVALIRRFASSGMTLVSLGVMGSGQVDTGLALWRQADALFDEDKAGFQMSLKAFRGW
jgi:hypothetical protein